MAGNVNKVINDVIYGLLGCNNNSLVDLRTVAMRAFWLFSIQAMEKNLFSEEIIRIIEDERH